MYGLNGLAETKRENKSASIHYPSWPPRLSPHGYTSGRIRPRIRPHTPRVVYAHAPTHRILAACVRALLAGGGGRVYAPPATPHPLPPTASYCPICQLALKPDENWPQNSVSAGSCQNWLRVVSGDDLTRWGSWW